MRIAMIGTRGVPATYGGIERHVEEVGTRLAERGHAVTVFCRPQYVDRELRSYRGMTLRVLPAVQSKHLEALTHSGLCSALALGKRYDVVHFHAIGPALWSPLPRYLSRSRVIVTVHGLDFERDKWNPLARRVFSAADTIAGRVPHERVVVARNLVEHYRERHGSSSVFIPNGVTPHPSRPLGSAADRLGLRGRGYLLFVGRLTPEKGVHVLLEAFRHVPADVRLVIVGGSSHTDEYVERVRALAGEDDRVVLAGYVYGEELEEMYSNALAFVQPSSLEGMPLTVLEAASFGRPLVLSDIPVHAELIETCAPGRRLFATGSSEDLSRVLTDVIREAPAETEAAAAARVRVLRDHDWERVVDQLEAVYRFDVARTRHQ